MTNLRLKAILTDASKILGGASAGISLYEWFNRIGAPTNIELKEELKLEITESINKLSNNMAIHKNAEVQAKALSLEEKTNALNNMMDKYSLNSTVPSVGDGIVGGDQIKAQSSDTFSEILKELGKNSYESREFGKGIADQLSSTRDLLNAIVKYDDENKKNFIGVWDYLEKYLREFHNYTQTLSVHDLALLVNISLSVFILGCLITIFFSFYGDILITKFNLEQRIPKLANIIKLRRKFIHFSILLHFFLILLALIIMTFVNVVTLMH